MEREVPALTPIMRSLIQFYQDFWDRHGYGPTIREIAAARQRSPTTVLEQVHILIRRGYLEQIGPYGAATGRKGRTHGNLNRCVRVVPGVKVDRPICRYRVLGTVNDECVVWSKAAAPG